MTTMQQKINVGLPLNVGRRWSDVFRLLCRIVEENRGHTEGGQPSPCWIWTGALDKDGYPQMKVLRRCYQAHRVAYHYFNGPIPKGLDIDHLCHQRGCVNPAHLSAEEPEVNRYYPDTPPDDDVPF